MRRQTEFAPLAAALLTFLLILVSPAHSVGPAAAQDSVTLSFAWPEDLAARVAYRINRIKQAGVQSQNLSMSGTYDVSVSPVSDGLLVHTSNFDMQVEGAGASAGPQAKLQQFMIKAASTPPNFVVNRQGQYVRLEGLEQFQTNLRQAMDEMMAGLPEETRQRVMQAIEPMTSKAQLESSIVNNWNRDVGTWLGASFDLGDTYELKFNNTVPMFGNLNVPMVSRFRFLARVPCRSGGQSNDCVDLEARTFVDSAGLAKALQAFIAQFGDNPGEAPSVKRFHLNTTIRLVTEPNTLIPHRMTSTKVSDVVLEIGGTERASKQTEEIEVVYNY